MDEGRSGEISGISVQLTSAASHECVGVQTQKMHPWRTGRGLAIQDSCGRTEEIYGPPESKAAGETGGKEAVVLFYSFDWAGSTVPQSMEVTCEAGSKKVVKITLAAASL
jgi:hypothetical protein